MGAMASPNNSGNVIVDIVKEGAMVRPLADLPPCGGDVRQDRGGCSSPRKLDLVREPSSQLVRSLAPSSYRSRASKAQDQAGT